MATEKEDRAIDALIVLALREPEGDEVDVKHLPRLTKEERAALDSLDPGFIERLLSPERKRRDAGKITKS